MTATPVLAALAASALAAGIAIPLLWQRHKRRKAPPLPRRIPWPPRAVKPLGNDELREWVRFLSSWWDTADEPQYPQRRQS